MDEACVRRVDSTVTMAAIMRVLNGIDFGQKIAV